MIPFDDSDLIYSKGCQYSHLDNEVNNILNAIESSSDIDVREFRKMNDSFSENQDVKINQNLTNNNCALYLSTSLGLKIENEENNNENENTDINRYYLNKKRKLKEKIFCIDKSKKSDKNIIITKKKKGRKNKSDKTKSLHNKESDDNIIRKIKVHIFKYCLYVLNQNFQNKNKKNKILKLNHEKIMNLKRNANLNLFNKTLKNIFSEIEISQKFSTHNSEENKKLITKIYKGIIKEEKIKQILDLTFSEILDIFRKNIIEDIENKEKINSLIESKLNGVNLLINNEYEGIDYLINNLRESNFQDNYIDKIIDLTLNYENWFENKIGRD